MPDEMTDAQDSRLSSTMKELTLTPVITSLVKPSADLLGRELHDFLKEKLDSFKKRKRVENVAGHLKNAQARLNKQCHDSQPPTENVKQLEFFEQWVEGAQNVSPDDGELAILWQELLVKGMSNSSTSNLLIDKLKMLSIDEAKTLVSLRKRRNTLLFNDKTQFFIKSLADKGLVRIATPHILAVVSIIALSSYFILSVYGSIEPNLIPNILHRYVKAYETREMYNSNLIATSAILTTMLTLLWYKLDISFIRLTWAGSELVSHAPRISQHTDQ